MRVLHAQNDYDGFSYLWFLNLYEYNGLKINDKVFSKLDWKNLLKPLGGDLQTTHLLIHATI